MASANDIINRAGRRVKILGEEEAFTSAQAVNALQLLNDMMHGFGPRGIKYAHTTLAASDTVNVPDEQLRNLVLMFAEELAIDYGYPIDAKLEASIADAKNELQAAYWIQPPAETDAALRPRAVAFDITRLE